jgi:phosphomannomutase
MAKAGKKLSELAAAHQVYHNSGEINFKVADTDAVLQKLTESYAEGSIDTLDGVKIVFDDWWFSVRSSNTEPVIRFVMEANTEALLEEKKSEVTAIISQ